MKYAFYLPLTALIAVSIIQLLVYFNLIPPGLELLEGLERQAGEYFFLLICAIILLESIVYVGFYFPGQFFAVVLVISANPTFSDVLLLTVAMVFAATLGSLINYFLGARFSDKSDQAATSTKRLLLAMIHMNSLAFFMFDQGAAGRPLRVVWLAGLLNLPYYLLLISATAFLSEEVMQIAESTWLLLTIICVWLAVALYIDAKKGRFSDKWPVTT